MLMLEHPNQIFNFVWIKCGLGIRFDPTNYTNYAETMRWMDGLNNFSIFKCKIYSAKYKVVYSNFMICKEPWSSFLLKHFLLYHSPGRLVVTSPLQPKMVYRNLRKVEDMLTNMFCHGNYNEKNRLAVIFCTKLIGKTIIVWTFWQFKNNFQAK